MGAGASASAQGSQRGGSSQAGDSEGEGDTTVGSTATKTTLPGALLHAVTFFVSESLFCFRPDQSRDEGHGQHEEAHDGEGGEGARFDP